MAYLVFSSARGKEIGRRRLDKSLTIGRSPDCDISLHDIQLSRHHCRLERTRDGWLLTDLGSKNGVRVNGQLVQDQPLRFGDRIKLAGSVSFRIEYGKKRYRQGVMLAALTLLALVAGLAYWLLLRNP